MLIKTKIGELIAKIEKLNEVTIWLASAGDESILEMVAELQRDQLREGERPDGTNFDDYSPASVNIFGKTPGPMTWENSGYFYKNIQAIARPNEIAILNEGTIDEVTGARIDLEIKFDEIIIGLQNDSIKELVQALKKKYVENIRSVLFGRG
jgi:hypothetical protein